MPSQILSLPENFGHRYLFKMFLLLYSFKFNPVVDTVDHQYSELYQKISVAQISLLQG